ncbi:hemin ABC transporter substrate-binding protein [Seohaeicola nanhaiensis]|uniref:Hemin ABC transporter substrate-binding protein n=1 Tax=Seohaeicola nanhaiensis TaxID=1387282 RepID=A0ABV9KNB7_9RHOB
MRAILCAGALALAAPAQANEPAGAIVSIGGAVTEIVFALGAGDRLVARDTTSVYPEAALALPDVGYMRALSPEGVLSVGPDLILADQNAGPPETVEVLKDAEVAMVQIPDVFTGEGVQAKIRTIGAAIGVEDKAEALATDVAARLEAAQAQAEARAGGAKKRVLFVLSAAGGRIMASGSGTAAAAMIELAGAENAVTGFEGYKPLTDEAVISAAPDAILMMDRGGDHDSPVDQLVALPWIAATPAGQARAVVRMDGLYLLGFGPRIPEAVADLNAALYGG